MCESERETVVERQGESLGTAEVSLQHVKVGPQEDKIEIFKTCTDGHAMSALWSRANWQPQSRGSRALLGY